MWDRISQFASARPEKRTIYEGQDAFISASRRVSRLRKRRGDMSDLHRLGDVQTVKPEPFSPKSHGKPHVDGRRVLSGIIFINRNGL